MSASIRPAAPPSAMQAVCDVARQHAEAVDRDGRFPAETIAALRAGGLFATLVPARFGGAGATLRQAAADCYALGRCCASSAMVLAMHHIQVASLADHLGDTVWLRRFLARVAAEGLLLASVTSEAGVGGMMRTSLCAVEPTSPGRFHLIKQATTISYGAAADALLVTARAHPDSTPGDQVLVVIPNEPGVLTQRAPWNAMGMRGTCSGAFTMEAEGGTEQIIPTPFAQIAADTMVPVSHLLWSGVWCGIAAEAVTRARLFLRGKMRAGQDGLPDGAGHLVQATERLLMAEARVRQALAAHEAGPDPSIGGAAAINMLKTGISDICLAIVEDACQVCGFAGYANAGPFSLSRHLRDIRSARLMIHNDRVRDNTARLLVMQQPPLGIA